MSELPPCPECQSAFTYADAPLLICPECGHEWTDIVEPESSDHTITAFDANGTPLTDGDTVIIIKDLKVKGASSALKIGTKVKQIRLVEGDHNIDCKIPGFGDMKLKSEFVKKG